MKLNFEETGIPNDYSLRLKNEGIEFAPQHTSKIFSVLTNGVSEFLQRVKSKEAAAAVAIEDLKGKLLLAGIIKYHPNEENPDMPGNWSYEWTYDPADLENVKVYKITEPQVMDFFDKVAFKLWHMQFNSSQLCVKLVTLCASVLIDWLDTNASEVEDKEVILDGYFTASVGVEKGEKVKDFVPDGAMKVLVKGDAQIEAA